MEPPAPPPTTPPNKTTPPNSGVDSHLSSTFTRNDAASNTAFSGNSGNTHYGNTGLVCNGESPQYANNPGGWFGHVFLWDSVPHMASFASLIAGAILLVIPSLTDYVSQMKMKFAGIIKNMISAGSDFSDYYHDVMQNNAAGFVKDTIGIMLNILDSFVKTLDWEDGAIVSADIVGWFGLDGISDGAAQAIADGIGGGFFAADVALFSYNVATSWQSYNSR